MMYYKVLDKMHRSCNGGDGVWKPGVWMPEITESLEPCRVGYHLCRKKDLMGWLDAEIWVAEGRGQKIICDDKVVFSQARVVKKLDTWNDMSARLFACDCAEHVLPFFEKKYPDDSRPRDCIEVARRYACGEASEKELDAAGDVARSARDAAWVAEAARSARAADWVARRYACGEASEKELDAAGDVARSARDAVWVAWAAAWADRSARAADWAARAARDVARSARDAVWVAWAAAWADRDARSAEKKWQTRQLFKYLNGVLPKKVK